MDKLRNHSAQQPVAIIGMACRFPGADNYNAFWQNLLRGASGVSEIPIERWNWKEYKDKLPGDGQSGKWGGFIRDAGRFDAAFFQLSGKEAELMDPQQRIMLELTWSCLEDAGIPPSRVSGSDTGIFLGVFNHDYKELAERADNLEAHYGTGTSAAIVANRLSYFFNFKGPSVPVDTACSSSLQAIHMAAQSIQVGECGLALAGGISMMFTPAKHIAFAKAGMLSPTGSCKSFDQSADGYVRSEGAGVLLLKSLQAALEDGDTIHGILRGSAVNHCGKTYTLTYPSTNAQAEVIARAVKRSGLAPETISYVEAHGTGTPKGDPIELEGLINAFTRHFQTDTKKSGYCGLGSVKASIGHLESAAGVAGVIKVLLAMKHRQLPGLANFRQLNSRISLSGTPFYIVDKTREWAIAPNESGETYTRRAGVSSFGFGGTNAHVVLEETTAPNRDALRQMPGYLICLSAKNADALNQKIASLRNWVSREGSHTTLADISFTLLTGREHFQVRWAFIATDLQSLSVSLQNAPQLDQEAKAPLSLTQQQQADQLLAACGTHDKPIESIYLERLHQLAALYTCGYNGDWTPLFQDSGARRIAMPTYPFQGNVHWLPPGRPATYLGSPDYHTRLNGTQMSSSITLSGNEFFLKDHIFSGQKILPAVVYMELACRAVHRHIEKEITENEIINLKNMVWTSPLIIHTDPATLHVEIKKKQDGEWDFEAFSFDKLHLKTTHSRGTALVVKPTQSPSRDSSYFLSREDLHPMESEYFYQLLTQAGFDYGPSHRMISQLTIGDQRIVAKLKTGIPEPETTSFTLHPGYMDAALQATMGWLAVDIANGIQVKTQLPFTTKLIEVFSPCNDARWVVVHTGKAAQAVDVPLDIDLCNASGKVCVRISGYVGRSARRRPETIAIEHDADVHKLESFWTDQPGLASGTSHFDNHIAVLCQTGYPPSCAEDPKWQGIEHHILESDQAGTAAVFSYHAWKLLEIVQDMAVQGRGKILLQVVVGGGEPAGLLSGLSGLLKTTSAEYAKVHTQIIEWKSDSGDLPAVLLVNKALATDHQVRYQNGQRLIKSWRPIQEQSIATNPWKNNGIYLITGGMGGLGLVFAEEIMRMALRTTIILTGRSPLSAENETRLSTWQNKGATVIYRQLDVANAADLRGTMDWITNTFGRLNAILHAAGVINDNYIIRKTRDEFEKVLVPKVPGLIHLDETSADMQLDFFALFSSTSGVLGNIGQSDYGAANTFMDEYARYRNDLVIQGKRSGKTISISWPFWKEGGMRITDSGIAALYRYAGMVPLETRKGLHAFYSILCSPQDHVLVMQGDIEPLSSKLQIDLTKNPSTIQQEPLNEPTVANQESNLNDDLVRKLVQIAADILKSSPAALDPKAPLEEYGFDSILYTDFALRLNETFQSDITPVLFFQHSTIASLAAYLGNAYKEDTQTQSLAADAAPRAIPEPSLPNQQASIPAGPDRLEWVTHALCGYAAQVLKVPTAEIDPAIGMDEYGYDSIRYTEFTIKINEGLGLHIAPTIFFEYGTLNALAGHLQNQLPASFDIPLSSNGIYKQPGQSQASQPDKPQTAETTDNKHTDPASAPIAIIGISGSFAMSENVEELWKNLVEERDCITEIPADRWDWRSHFGNAASEPDKTDVKWGGFVTDLNAFDASFFNISPGEAAYIDPQQRLLLMHTWKALEDAGYAPEQFYGSNTPLFTGITSHEYSARVSKMNVKTEGYHQSSIISCIGPNRVSYYLNLHGTSEPVDTACSSSLVAIHRAVREIRSGECDVAIAGGVTVLSSLPSYISFDKAGMLSKDGRSKTFSDQANGYVRAEGAGIMLLKRLDLAERDGDHIYGVIRSTAVNHGGRANSLSAPNMRAQAALLHAAYSKAGIDPRTVGYIEAHGTGTKIGDPIEIDALKAAFGQLYKETGSEQVQDVHCGIGSIKTNIGHSEYAAGMAGLMKVLLQMKHQTLTRTLHCQTINPYIDLKGSPFFIVQKTQPWKALVDASGKELPRRAGVSSFGFGGVNAHVVIEEYVDKRPAATPYNQPGIFVLSAKKQAQLHAQAQQLISLINSGKLTDNTLAEVAYTLQVGRNAMKERLCVIAGSWDELRMKLEAFLRTGTQAHGIYAGSLKKTKSTEGQPDKSMFDQQIIGLARSGDHQRIAQLWVEGNSIPWAELYGPYKPRRISLPTYPFARDVFKLDAEYRLSAAAQNEISHSQVDLMQAYPTPASPPSPNQAPVEIRQPATPGHKSHIQQILIESIARLLNMDPANLATDENLDEYGFDSVLYTQFAIELNDQFGLDLTPAVFFRYPDVQQLSAFLSEEYPVVFAQSAGQPTQQPAEAQKTHLEELSALRTGSVTSILTQKVATILKFDQELIEPDVDLNEYGLDSIIITQLTNELNAEFGMDLTPNIIFGCHNLNALSSYLLENYPNAFPAVKSDQQVPSAGQKVSNGQLGAELSLKMANSDRDDKTAVAIVGLSLQFPMAKDANQFWDNLMQEKHCISEIPADRWDWRDYPELKIKWGGFMDDMATFDPLFFKISPAEALQMDPQQRLMMQHTWKAIEDAGYNPESLAGSDTGIFMGILCYEYSKLLAKAGVPIASHSLMGMVGSMGPNRMSYFLDIHGPSEAIETACSSSLVAIHRAVEAIRSGSCRMALAGGVNTLLSPDVFASLNEAGTLSPDGCCRPFSDNAKGYVRGEGVGVLFLKKLEDAERDGDHIYGLIRGTSENHGGRANTLTSPNPKAQASLLEHVYSKAGVDPRTVGYIETHGTGTELGDPIEVGALKKAFGSLYEQRGAVFNGDQHCGIGSVKSNIGHLEVAAGVAGVAKALLQMKHKRKVKSLHTDRLNPYIDFSNSPFYVVRQTEEWRPICNETGEELPRRAGVSSFGFGGVSAHLVLEEYVPSQRVKTYLEPAEHLIVLSAKNNERLREQAKNLLDAIENNQINNQPLRSIAYTLQVGRQHMEERFAVVVSSLTGLCAALSAFLTGMPFEGVWYQGNIKNLNRSPQPRVTANGSLAWFAESWVGGGAVDWNSLHKESRPVRISLPTYPFERKRFWPFDNEHQTATNQPSIDTSAHAGSGSLQMRAIVYFKNTISQLVKIPVQEIQETEMLIHYGVDSIAISRLLVKMRNAMPKLTNSIIFEHPTIAELVGYLLQHEPEGLQQLLGEHPVKNQDTFFSGNSMILLNEGSKGRPVFWFHPGGGGIDGYQHMAQVSDRPFYGVVADQWIREGRAIQGIPQMAATYLNMIRTIQPQGPYDLGGFSLGGALAYEITRQLQIQGQSVATITMIDSIFIPNRMDNFLLDYKTMLLQTVNLLLLSQVPRNGQTSHLIHRNELDHQATDKAFLDRILILARSRGLTYPAGYLEAIVTKALKVRDASRFTDYLVQPLVDPASVRCHYFANQSRSFYGALRPYFILDDRNNVPLEDKQYWSAWQQNLTYFEKTELNATDHVTLMNDRATIQPVIDLCRKLYSTAHSSQGIAYSF